MSKIDTTDWDSRSDLSVDRDPWRAAWIACGAVTLTVSLGLRVWHRGPYAPGWDFIGGATGLWLWSTRTPGEILAWTWGHAFDTCRVASCQAVGDRVWYWNLLGLSIVPGFFAAVVPWLWWPQLWTAVVSGTAFLCAWRATGAPLDLLLLAVASSGLLLSWTIMGLLYMSCLLPHAIALWTTQRLRNNPAWSAILGVVACALSWQGQELGQLVGIPLLMAGLLCRDAPRASRAVWGGIGMLQLALVCAFPSHNVAGHWQWPAWSSPGASLANVLQQTPQLPDAMALTVLGLVAAVGLRGRERWFWRSAVAVPLGAACWLLARTAVPQGHGVGGLWPRRYLLADFYLLAITLQWGAERLRSGHGLTAIRTVLLCAALLEVGRTVQWSLVPLPMPWTEEVESLPHTATSIDLHVHPPSVDLALAWIAQIKRGDDVFTRYPCNDQHENGTDPQTVLARIYLAVGNDAFRRHMKGLDREGALCLPLNAQAR